MAFNPFSTFRKFFKPMMAALAVMCMFIFVLSSGLGQGGDFFDQLPRWLNKGSKGPTVATVYGQSYDVEMIDQVKRERQIASDYMRQLTPYAQLNLLSELKTDGLAKLSDEIRTTLRPIVELRLSMLQNESTDQRQNQMLLFQYLNTMQQSMTRLEAMLGAKRRAAQADATPNETTLRDIDALQGVLQVMTYDSKSFGSSNFFESVKNDSTRDALEFILWNAKAEQMGIKLDPGDLRKELLRDFFGRNPDPKIRAVIERGIYGQNPGMTAEKLTQLLEREYRVRIAQATLLGNRFAGRTPVVSPAFATPREWYEFYREVASQTSFFAFSLPVSTFVPKVTATPTDEELTKLFEQFKGQEPDPARETPGFKQPRRVQVAWIGGSSDLAFYRTRAPKTLSTQIAATQIAKALTFPAGGGAFPTIVTVAVALNSGDAPLRGLYDEYLSRRFTWGDSLTPKLRDTSVIRPAPIATLVAHSFAAAATKAPIFSAMLSFENQVIAAEVRDRVRVGMPMVLAGLSPVTPAFALNATAPSLASIPLDLPFAALRARFVQKLEGDLLSRMLLSDLTNFATELPRLATERAPVIAENYFETFAKERGLLSGQTKGVADKFALAEDPALAPLKALFGAGHGGAQLKGTASFGEFFFTDERQFNQPGEAPPGKTFTPRWYPNGTAPTTVTPDQKLFLAWRIEDQAPKTLTFDEAKPQVIAAWKVQQARVLAQQAAEKLATEAKAIASDKAKLRDLGDRVKREMNGTWFELGPVAELNQDPSLSPESGVSFSAFTLPPDVSSPRPETVAKLLSLKDKSIGESVQFTNIPSDTVYTAMLVGKAEKKESDFLEVFASLRKFGASGQFDQKFMEKKGIELYSSVTQQMRQEAGYTEDVEAITKRLQDEARSARFNER